MEASLSAMAQMRTVMLAVLSLVTLASFRTAFAQESVAFEGGGGGGGAIWEPGPTTGSRFNPYTIPVQVKAGFFRQTYLSFAIN